MKTRNLSNLTACVMLFLIVGTACTISLPWRQSSNAPPPTPAASPTTTTDEDTEKLQKRLDELENELEQQKKQPVQPQTKKSPPVITDTAPTARVSSPNDGFLALRTEPSVETGERILAIPHGATVDLLGCRNLVERVGGRAGRWCRVSYDGYTGWAFDGWLVY